MIDKTTDIGLESLSGLAGMGFSLYDSKQRLLVSSGTGDKLLALARAAADINRRYKDLIEGQLRLSLLLQETVFVQGPTGQYHAFIPLQYESGKMVAVAEAFYISRADFSKFYYSDSGRDTDIKYRTEDEWLKEIRIFTREEMEASVEHAGTMLKTIVASKMKNSVLRKSSRQLRAILNIMSHINSFYSAQDVCNIVVETVMSLFDIDTAAFFIRRDGYYQPETAEGRIEKIVRSMRIPYNNRVITVLSSSTSSFLTFDSHALLHAEFPEPISNATLYPFHNEAGMMGMLAIFNSSLDRKSSESIADLCKLATYLLGLRQRSEDLATSFVRMDGLSMQLSSLSSLYCERDRLYHGILNEASSLVEAEKCSLMMPDDSELLEVRASKGVDRSLVNNVRVRKGEGISGKVYENGIPALINGENDIRNYGNTPRPHYKTSSSLSLPLKVADEIVGVLNLSDKRSGHSFAQSDILSLSPFILQASTILKLCTCKDSLEEMTKLSITDPLTGLFNRRYFDIRLEEEYLRSKRYSLDLSLAILDIDDFKAFNDNEGHLSGDSILKEVAYIMNSAVRSHDILTRIGGEEFAILMPQTSEEQAFRVSERIREGIKQKIRPTWKSYPKKQLTICSGIATYPDCGLTKADMLSWADKALYSAKRRGKDRTVTWNEASDS